MALLFAAALLVSPALVQPQDSAVKPTAAPKVKRALRFEEVAAKPGVDQIRFVASMDRWSFDGSDPAVLMRKPAGGGASERIDAASGRKLAAAKGAQGKGGGVSDEVAELIQRIEGEISGASAGGKRYADKEIAKIAKALGSGFEQRSDDGKTTLVYVSEELWVRRE